MCMYKACLAVGVLVGLCQAASGEPPGTSPKLGHEMSAAEVAQVDFVVLPDGEGLPPGSGSAKAGQAVYEQHCIACHGERGKNGTQDALAGGEGTISGPVPNKTVGSYWPYATTLFDYVRRSMPYQDPGSLTNDETYAVTAYVLYLNGIVSDAETIDAATLPKVKMPNRDNFVRKYEQ